MPSDFHFDIRRGRSDIDDDFENATGVSSDNIIDTIKDVRNGTYASTSDAALTHTSERSKYVPSGWTRFSGNPILSAGDAGTFGSPNPSIYWPWVMKMRGVLANPVDDWYCYYSTDHDNAAGGLGMMTGPTPLGPWTNHGLIYQDLSSGAQTETPSVVADTAAGVLRFYYQQAGVSGAVGVQSTCMATTPLSGDGGISSAITRVGKVLDVTSLVDQPGDGHTGYFRPFRIHNQWWGYSLCGGSIYSHSALWSSRDGITWRLDNRPLVGGVDLLTSYGIRQWGWTDTTPVEWRGMLWAIGKVTNWAAGTDPKTAVLAMAPLTSNLRSLASPPETILDPSSGAATWESGNVRAMQAFTDRGRLYVAYQCDGHFGIAYTN